MNLKRFLPDRYEKRAVRKGGDWEDPLAAFQREMNRMFDDFFEGFSMIPAREARVDSFIPRVNVSESEKEITVTAELPGMDEKDVEVTLDRGLLLISGQKEDEKEERGRNHYYMERASGSFHREIPIPEGYDEKNVKASFRKGVLKVVVPILPEVRADRKNIPIKTE